MTGFGLFRREVYRRVYGAIEETEIEIHTTDPVNAIVEIDIAATGAVDSSPTTSSPLSIPPLLLSCISSISPSSESILGPLVGILRSFVKPSFESWHYYYLMLSGCLGIIFQFITSIVLSSII